MPQSLTQNYLHIVFSTKDRQNFLQEISKPELHKYIAKIILEHESPVIAINNMPDHIHVLISLSKNHSLATVLKHTKQASSKWIKEKSVPNFSWQRGYAALSVSQSNAPRVIAYIKNQEQHHQKFSYQDELRKFLKAYEIAFDEKYLWD